MSVSYTIARPYAKAIFEIAVKNNTIQKWQNMLILINAIASHKQIKYFLSGALSPKYLSYIFFKISGKNINMYAKNLVRLLSENQRLRILKDILKHFLELNCAHQNILVVHLITAHPFSKKQIFDIRKILENIFLKKIEFVCKINRDIISGFILKTYDTVFDFSIRSHLNQLFKTLNP
ncbi:MAG: F0F1 ATP synthase subunit delta [Buchnera aphidicola (Pentalonia nigronervosa)]|jgi:F-type H+-transporting ATPase subunit delta|uniref:ATP synthase subunit delta n=1 Tax=Buchnera aphidicola (Pentalonia nigronervosa) TaxID=1309793 RepID=A0A7H1AZ59_9GAMM|nr:MAG: F0F1 ATP synthase subunit delta [Buchnera aphidicola (Pentalonia nigronervosa)]